MIKENAILWEVSFSEFIFVTVILAGAAAFMTGRAAARAWEPDWLLALYIVLLAAATRFIHFSLFDGTLLSLHYYIVDFIVLLGLAILGKRITRSKQMAGQYRFLFERRGWLGWIAREPQK